KNSQLGVGKWERMVVDGRRCTDESNADRLRRLAQIESRPPPTELVCHHSGRRRHVSRKPVSWMLSFIPSVKCKHETWKPPKESIVASSSLYECRVENMNRFRYHARCRVPFVRLQERERDSTPQ